MENEKKKYTFKDIAWRDLLIIPIIGVLSFALTIAAYIGPILFNYYEIDSNLIFVSTITQALAYTIGIGAFYLFHLKVMSSRLRAGFAYIKKYWLRLSITYIIALILIYTYEYMTQFLPKHLQYSETANELELNKMFEVPAFLPVAFLLIVIVGPIVEEIVFRHILIGELGKKFNFIAMSIVSVFLFAFIHVTDAKSPFEFGPYLILSIILVFTYLKSGRNLGSTIALHIANNFVSFVISVISIYA
ncbi:TPA: CPBP family intramembrane metalloprotease SdpB [Staphylococcus aureus]|uniref:CPBP family intramembrane glutamic endopeptidase SdpB n=1 Tax=Staphylococcus aureus TaxID=1280 RepID=UPI000CD0B9D5|nr:CPBP family intramembrane glutamic endopeptidase SdpB [Staphylococcus aureus]HCU8061002.1 CPBP family intramembrane metalloprotease SdpB [Staphylococcus aureus]HCU8179548.1 CPBP family intramembrane metalloprotease SdpB [Staphylococcus aureus]HCU9147831.1 CPBP family intramembrane metalloprotease SdpB [Staphylococcus aureus]HCU9166360.1 CPBP family intramembrane metalloprotease SdpB [Staphylococcus aureus]HCZ8143968.1 CPBP family intramembrane metalloprotease SdpB [Staphylococcus aureus]